MTPRRLFYILTGSIVVLLGLGGYGYYFALGQLSVARNNYASALTAQTKAADELDQLTNLKAKYKRDITPIADRIDDALPRQKNQTEILAQLQAVATSSGLKLTGVTLPSAAGLPSGTSQTVKSGKVLALPIMFELKGTYSQLQSFLARVENLNRFTNVTNLAVSSDSSGAVTYSMTVNAYIMP